MEFEPATFGLLVHSYQLSYKVKMIRVCAISELKLVLSIPMQTLDNQITNWVLNMLLKWQNTAIFLEFLIKFFGRCGMKMVRVFVVNFRIFTRSCWLRFIFARCGMTVGGVPVFDICFEIFTWSYLLKLRLVYYSFLLVLLNIIEAFCHSIRRKFRNDKKSFLPM